MTDPGEDLSALSWVVSELQRSLDAAHKSLRRFLKEAQSVGVSDVDSADTAILRAARTQLHQGVGALELLGLSVPAKVLRASEAAVQRMVAKPAIVDGNAVDAIEGASFAILDYMQRLLARRPMSGVALFPQYRAVQQLAGGDRIHPADLWGANWHWQDLPDELGATPRKADDAARGAMEILVLALLRKPDTTAKAGMSSFCAELGAGARSTLAATTWKLAAAFFDAQAHGLLDSDLYAKRMASRLLAQLRANVRSDEEVSERLAADLLFFCARATVPMDGQAPRLQAVRQAWQLGETSRSTDYETPRLGRFDPSLVMQARKRVASAKDVWSAVAGGETRRLQGLAEPFTLLADSLQRLFPSGDALAHSLQNAAAQTAASGEAPSAALAMEVATAMLWLDAVIEDGEFDSDGLGQRLRRVAQRIDDAAVGGPAQPLEPWVEELYRRVSDHQTMGSVVQELRAALTEVEKQIDEYFRNPAQREVLMPVPAQLTAMRSVLSVLDLEHAAAAVVHMRDAVDELASTQIDSLRAWPAAQFSHLADNLGALGFLIDMLSVQPQLAKKLFSFDAEQGKLLAVMALPARQSVVGDLDASAATAEPLVDQAQTLALAATHSAMSDAELVRQLEALSERATVDDQAELARVTTQAHQALDAAVDDDSRQAAKANLAQAVNALTAVPEASGQPIELAQPRITAEPVTDGDTGLEDDDEMRGIFIEEAQEVIGTARESLLHLAANSENLADITIVRRAFHTLKGSSRMVGLRDFGEAAWACEQLYNARLADDARVDPPLQEFSAQALNYLAHWIDAIQARDASGHVSSDLVAAADAVRNGLPATAIAAPQPPTWVAPVALAAQPTVGDVAQPEQEFALDVPDLNPDDVHAPADLSQTSVFEPVNTLAQRVPELPSAADLDLPFLLDDEMGIAPEAERAQEPQPVAEQVDDQTLDFELDLDQLQATPSAEAFEIDDGFSDVFTALPAEAPAEPVPTIDVADAQELDFDAFVAFELASPLSITATEAVEAAEAVEAVPTVTAVPADVDISLDATVEPGPDVLPEASPEAPLDFALADDNGVPLGVHALADATTADVAAAPSEQLVQRPEASGLAASQADEEPVKVIGGLRIGIPLFNIFLNEADEQSRRLVTELAEWALEHKQRAVSETAVALAHSLAGNSATVGYSDLSALSRLLEHALMRSQAQGLGRDGEALLFNEAADEVRRLLHQFAAGFLKPVSPDLLTRLADHENWPAFEQLVAPTPEAMPEAVHLPLPAPVPVHLPRDSRNDLEGDLLTDDIDAVDVLDAELLPIFEEEAEELLPQLQERMSDWHRQPGDRESAQACMRTLHTFKGGARLAGAMRLGEMAHRLETSIEAALGQVELQSHQLDPLQAMVDHMAVALKGLRAVLGKKAIEAESGNTSEPSPTEAEDTSPTTDIQAIVPTDAVSMAVVGEAQSLADTETAGAPDAPTAPLVAAAPIAIDWARFTSGAALPTQTAAAMQTASTGVVRVRAGLLDRLVNSAGEVSIRRARIESDVRQLQGALVDLTDSLDRMRRELRDIELQAETQISSRIEAAKVSAQSFDPLEMDRFTRLQELTRMMAESVNDVATLQRGLQRTLQSTEDQLAAQSRLTREMQDDLLRTRMVEFESMADRLYRVVRQTARDTGKQVRLDIVGGSIEVDRGVLERMVGSFEHLLRNSVVHGIELPSARTQAGKAPSGTVVITATQAGNEVVVEFADDGAGLDMQRIRARAVERGQLAADHNASEAELAQLIFLPGFSTANTVTELAGRGIGMDVVRAEVNAMGGRIENHSVAGLGMRLRLVLPLTTAVTQVVMLRCGSVRVAVPSTLVELVRRVPTDQVRRAHLIGQLPAGEEAVPFFWLASLIEGGSVPAYSGRSQAVVIVRSASQRVALHVDEVIGNQEVVVKNLGPQLARMPGLAGVTLLPSGTVALIYNPVALLALYGAELQRERVATDQTLVHQAPPESVVVVQDQRPLVMVVDDSLTVRRVTQRLLEREGYRVSLAKDGIDALERLAQERPLVMLCDIEMPRMDGFELVRNLRADPERAAIPVIMITSRIAQKHRDHAAQLGVEHYLGKPFAEEALLALVMKYTQPVLIR